MKTKEYKRPPVPTTEKRAY